MSHHFVFHFSLELRKVFLTLSIYPSLFSFQSLLSVDVDA